MESAWQTSPKKESSILSSQEQTLRLARSRGIDGMLTRNSDSTFEQRATFRHLADQAARQRNLEAIMVMASRHCEETAAGGEMDSDWLTRFLQLAEDISMVPMQQLWGGSSRWKSPPRAASPFGRSPPSKR